MYPTAKLAVPVEIKMTDAEVGDTLRVHYIEPTDPEIPESHPTEITYTGVVHRLTTNGTNAGMPIIRLRNFNQGRWGNTQGYTELSLANAHTILPTTVMLLNRPEKPFKLEDAEYYLETMGIRCSKLRITVSEGEVLETYAYEYDYDTTGYNWVVVSAAWDRPRLKEFTKDDLIKALHGKSSTYRVSEPKKFAMEPGVMYVARTRNPKKAATMRFESDTEWETFEEIDPVEILTGIGKWHYPEVYVNPRQHIFDRIKEMGITTAQVYEGFGTGQYMIDSDAQVLHAETHWSTHFRRTQQDTMKVLDAINLGTLRLVGTE